MAVVDQRTSMILGAQFDWDNIADNRNTTSDIIYTGKLYVSKIIMGNSQAKSTVNLTSLLGSLGALEERKVSPKSSPVSDIKASKITFKLQVPLDHSGVIGDINVTDNHYKSVNLVVGSTVTRGVLTGNVWSFKDLVPVCLLPKGECYIEIQTLDDADVHYTYKSCTMSAVKCGDHIVHGDRIYAQNCVY